MPIRIRSASSLWPRRALRTPTTPKAPFKGWGRRCWVMSRTKRYWDISPGKWARDNRSYWQLREHPPDLQLKALLWWLRGDACWHWIDVGCAKIDVDHVDYPSSLPWAVQWQSMVIMVGMRFHGFPTFRFFFSRGSPNFRWSPHLPRFSPVFHPVFRRLFPVGRRGQRLPPGLSRAGWYQLPLSGGRGEHQGLPHLRGEAGPGGDLHDETTRKNRGIDGLKWVELMKSRRPLTDGTSV